MEQHHREGLVRGGFKGGYSGTREWDLGATSPDLSAVHSSARLRSHKESLD